MLCPRLLLQLRGEMLLREENYNKHFRNGGAGARVLDVTSAAGSQQGLVDWMLKAGLSPGGPLGVQGSVQGRPGGGGPAAPKAGSKAAAGSAASSAAGSRRDTRRSTVDGRDAGGGAVKRR
jgi:hypothetical protein